MTKEQMTRPEPRCPETGVLLAADGLPANAIRRAAWVQEQRKPYDVAEYVRSGVLRRKEHAK